MSASIDHGRDGCKICFFLILFLQSKDSIILFYFICVFIAKKNSHPRKPFSSCVSFAKYAQPSTVIFFVYFCIGSVNSKTLVVDVSSEKLFKINYFVEA